MRILMSEITFDDIRVPCKKYGVSLTKLAGPLSDIEGYLSYPFGTEPTFVMTRVIFADGTSATCEGEHDTPYLVPDINCPKNMDDKTMDRLTKEGDQ
jgi:hypothetical protein